MVDRATNLLRLLPALGAAAAAMLPPAAPAQATAPDPNVVFLHWNDFHGQFRPQRATWRLRPGLPAEAAPEVGGAAVLAGYVRRERERAAAAGMRVVATDGGDWFQGTLEGNETRGRLVVEFLNRVQPDAVVLGNHEFDFGADNLRDLIRLARFPVLGANVVAAGTTPPRPWDRVRPFAVLDLHGLRVVVVGLLTRDTMAVSTGPWADAAFADEAATLRAALPVIRSAGDVVVLLTHCGVDTDRALARAFPEVPLILGGHSHTGLREPLREGGTWIVQTHGKASGIQRLEAHADAAGRRLHLLGGGLVEFEPSSHPPDADTEAWIAAATRDLAATWDQPIGRLEIDRYEERGPNSTPAGNLVADQLRAAAGAELGLTNKGGLRTRLASGPITRRQVYELLPFDNTLVSLTLTGADLKAVLQGALHKGRRPLEIGGGRYRYTERDGERVLLDVHVGDQPVADDRSYRVATSSFLARGGDGLQAFTRGTELEDHGLLLRDVLLAAFAGAPLLRADGGNRIEFVRP